MLQKILILKFNLALILEIIAACCSIIYSILLIKEKVVGWFFGILSSITSVVVFYHTQLYAQSLISIYYAAIGVYGWMYWKKARERNEHIHVWKLSMHLKAIVLFSCISILSWWIMKTYTNASSPLLDAFLTAFGFLASIKEARKILSSWAYWFVINALSGWLYYKQGLNIYAAMMLVYTIICIPGYIGWLKIYREFGEKEKLRSVF